MNLHRKALMIMRSYKHQREELERLRDEMERLESGDASGLEMNMSGVIIEGVSNPVESWAIYREKLMTRIEMIEKYISLVDGLRYDLFMRGLSLKRYEELSIMLEWHCIGGVSMKDTAKRMRVSERTAFYRRNELTGIMEGLLREIEK